MKGTKPLFIVIKAIIIIQSCHSAHVFFTVPSLLCHPSTHSIRGTSLDFHTENPHGGPVSKVRVWAGLSQGAAIFVVPWGRGQTPRYAARPNGFATVPDCTLQPFPNNLSHHANGPPDGAECPVTSAGVWECPCLGVSIDMVPGACISSHTVPLWSLYL